MDTTQACPHCEKPIFRKSADGAKLKAKTRILVLHKAGGEVEINCGSCGKGVLLPLIVVDTLKLRKAHMPKLVVRKGT